MSAAGALVLTYHGVEEGPAPLCLDPEAFEEQLGVLESVSATVLTVSALVAGLRAETLPACAVAITFDDGFASVGRIAAPLLARRGYPATVFAVADHVGGENDWPTQPERAPRRPLLGAAELGSLVESGWEIGSHGLSHRPLVGLPDDAVREELRESRARIAAMTGADVTAFAFPYGLVPARAPALLEATGYDVGFGGGPRRVDRPAAPFVLPRVDAHYLRRASRLRAAVEGRTAYLQARAFGSRARRLLQADHA